MISVDLDFEVVAEQEDGWCEYCALVSVIRQQGVLTLNGVPMGLGTVEVCALCCRRPR